jgi:uncharacterized protein
VGGNEAHAVCADETLNNIVVLTLKPIRITCGVMEEPFWKTTSLAGMTASQWESLCDGCGKCCLSKLEDEDTTELYWTTVACRLLDEGSCQCKDYPNRKAHVPDCVQLTPASVASLGWLPATCAYRLVANGHDLYWWHHLVSGSRETVHEAGVSMRGRITAYDDEMEDGEDYFNHVVEEEP